MLNVLVTGGAGFVGTALIDLVKHRKDLRLIVLDNKLSGPTDALEMPKNVTLVEGDVRDPELVDGLMRRADIAIHLAGVVGAPACDLDPKFADDVNVKGTLNVLTALGDRPIINISSTSVYGNKAGILVDEETEPTPLTSYGEHKLAAERIVKDFTDRFITFRPATAFGTSQRIRVDLLPNTLAYKALVEQKLDVFEPDVIRPFIHVIDFARALLWAVDNKMPWGHTYNLGRPSLTVKKGDLAKWLCRMAAAEYIERPGTDPDMRNYDVSFDKLVKTKFEFFGDFNTGFYDMLSAKERIAANYGKYNTVYLTQQFINKERGNA